MKIFLIICLASSLASSEKLDRSYLPPPGSKFSGGRPGDIEVPFEFPKETYSTGRPQLIDGKPDIELGINQRPATPTGAPDNRKPGFTNFRNSVPTTTTSYAITQTTTFVPGEDYDALDQPTGFINGSNRIQPSFPGQTYQQQPIRGPGQGPSFKYRPGESQPSTVTPYGTTSRPLFPGTFKGPGYLPPAAPSGNRGQPGQVSQDGFGFPSGQPQRPEYQDGQLPNSDPTNNQLGYVSPGSQQNQFIGSQNTPSSTATPQYQDGRFGPTGLGYHQNQNQFEGSQFPSLTTAPQYQTGQRLPSPGSNQQNQFPGNQNNPSSTAVPSFQTGQQFSTPGLNQQQFESRVPNQQIQFTGNQNFPSSTSAPTPSSIKENQYLENQNFPSTAAPNYQIGQRFTTPSQIQGGFVPEEQRFGSRVPSQQGQNQYTRNQNFPSPNTASQFQDGTPGNVQEGYQYQVPTQQNQNQYSGNRNFPSSTTAPQYQSSGPIRQNPYPGNENFPSTAAPIYQDGQRFTTPGQSQGGLISDQQRFGSRIPSQQSQNQYTGNQDFPSSTAAPPYQDNQRFTTPGNQIFPSSTSAPTPGSIQSNQFVKNQNVPSTAAPNYQNGQRFTTPGQIQEGFVTEQQRFGSRVPSQQSQNQYTVNQNFLPSTATPEYQAGQLLTTPENQYPGRQSIPSSTAAPYYQDQRFTTPGQQETLPNQPNYPGSTTAPQYQQTFASTSETNQQGFIPNQQNEYQRPAYNQQITSSTTAPGRFTPGSQSYGNDGIQTTPGTAVSFPDSQGTFTGGQTAPKQPTSQTGAGFPVYGTTSSPPSRFSNQGFPSTTTGSLPSRDFSPTPGNVAVGRPERPQAEGDRNAEIINYENVLTPEGYYYSYDTSNGIHADEAGTVGNGTRAQGGFSYTGDDGKVYSVFYSADENGFLPRGDHLPTPPPIPEAIQRVIDQANEDNESLIEDDGSYNEEKYGYMKYEGLLTRLRPKNKTVPIVNGADIPDTTVSRIGKPNNNMMKLKGGKVTTENYLETNNGEELEREPESGDVDINGEDRHGDDDNSNKNKDTNRRVSTKRPKPIKNLTAEDSRPNKFIGNKMSMKSTIFNSKVFDKNGSSRRPMSPDENEAPDFVSESDISEEQEDNGNRGESQDVDFDSDLINYKDDPNNRTDFRGLNKYLPNPKGANRKNQSSEKRPTAHVDGTRRPFAGVTKTERPGDRNSQTTQEIESDIIDEVPTRVPSRKNQFGQTIQDLSKINAQPASFNSDDETNMFTNDDAMKSDEYGFGDKIRPAETDFKDKPKTSQSNKKISGKPKRPTINESTEIPDDKETKLVSDKETGYEYTAFNDDEAEISKVFNAGDKTRPVAADRKDKPRTYQSNNKTSGKPKKPTLNEVTGIPNNKDTISSDDETGYEYTPPQRKFESEGAMKFPSQKGTQTTLRPFMTKNVYGDDNELTDEDVDQNGVVRPGRPGRPMSTQKERYPGQGGDRYDENPNADVNGNERFTSTRKPPVPYEPTSSRRPFGRPQTTTLPQYEGQSVTDENRYNEPVRKGSQRPGDELYYNTNAPNRGTSKPNNNVHSSTTPLPGSASYRKYRPGQYQDKPTDSSAYYNETISPGEEIAINRPVYKPISGQVPSTTYRPNYSFGDRTSAPNNAITVDGFGRPITSTNAPAFDGTTRPTYSTLRPPTDEDLGNRPSQKGDKLRPTVGRFGVTSTQGPRYQSSTSGPIGEDFSGPKQPQRFDPDSGYYYK